MAFKFSKLLKWVAIGAAVGVFVAAIVVPFASPAALGVLGFSAAGPVAGSFAAATQASMGCVAAGSLFALAQSIAMGGAIPSVVSAIAGIAAGMVGFVGAAF